MIKVSLFIVGLFLLFISCSLIVTASEKELDINVRVVDTEENVSINKQEVGIIGTGLAFLNLEEENRTLIVWIVVIIILLVILYLIIRSIKKR